MVNDAKDKAKETLNAGKEKASAFMEEHDVKGKANATKDLLFAGKEQVNEKIKGLAFRGMVEKKVSPETRAKFPVLDKLIPLTNYIVCILVVVIAWPW